MMILPKPFESNTENPSDDTGNGREKSKAPSSEGSEDGEKGKRIGSDIETEDNDISVGNNIVLAFTANQPFFFGGGHAAFPCEIVKGDRFGTDETAFEIRMDFSCCTWSLCSLANRPCTTFLLTICKEGEQSK